MSYVPQNPWIRKMSTTNNITFPNKYNEEYYRKVINACALNSDLESIQRGDWTSKDKVMHSGGQKQRINLARALYQVDFLIPFVSLKK